MCLCSHLSIQTPSGTVELRCQFNGRLITRRQLPYRSKGNRNGVLARGFAFHQCDPGSIGYQCGLRKIVVGCRPPPGTSVFLSSKTNISKTSCDELKLLVFQEKFLSQHRSPDSIRKQCRDSRATPWISEELVLNFQLFK